MHMCINCRLYSTCAAIHTIGITLPDDIQLSLASDESELSSEVGSPDSHQSASRATEAGWDSLLCCPVHNQSYSWIAYTHAVCLCQLFRSSPSQVTYNNIFALFLYRIVFIAYSLSMEEIPGQSPLLYQCSQTAPLCMMTMNPIDCFILISHDNSSSFVERYAHAFWSGYVRV